MRISSWLILLLVISLPLQAKDKQQQLDAACEAAREAKLAPEREQLIQECPAQFDKSLDECRDFYRDYGAALMRQGEIVRAPLYYDLPACEAAFEYRKRYRRPD